MTSHDTVVLGGGSSEGTAAALVASIIVPTLARNGLLADLLKTLADQIGALKPAERTSIEVIVADNSVDAAGRQLCDAVAAALPRLVHIHVAQRGVVHARNAGVAAAQGRYVIFLDDDEVPVSHWLMSWLTHAVTGVDVAFGPVEPLYVTEPETNRTMLDRMFTRRFDLPTGADITSNMIRLGTGNSMATRSLLNGKDSFDVRFNRTGGEDIHLLGQLVSRGVRLTWNRDAAVGEVVKADRMTASYLKLRRFNQAKLRCILALRSGGFFAWPRVALWMTVGLAQTIVSFGRYVLAGMTRGPYQTAAIELQGGLGKLFWYRDAKATPYAAHDDCD